MKYELIDGVERNRLFPDTFRIPDTSDLRVGEYVKIGVDFAPDEGEHINAERFWVQLDKIDGDRLSGEVNNDLIYTANHGLKCYDRIEFERRHVLARE